MARRDRSFTSDDVIRIARRNLNAKELGEVIFGLCQDLSEEDDLFSIIFDFLEDSLLTPPLLRLILPVIKLDFRSRFNLEDAIPILRRRIENVETEV